METKNAPGPTWINKVCITGPVYHYEKVTDDQLTLLGVIIRPGARAGSSARSDGILVRRLAGDLFNVRIKASLVASLAPDLTGFISTSLAAAGIEPPAQPPRIEHGSGNDQSGIWCLRLTDRTIDISPGAMEAFGAGPLPASMKISEALQLVPRVSRNHIERRIDMAIAGIPYNTNYTRRDTTGRLITLGSTASLVRDDDGRAVCLVGVLRRLVITDQLTSHSGEGVEA